MTTLEVASAYLSSYGWHSVPIPHKSKAPNLTGWQDLRLSADELTNHFNGKPQNIGVLLGEASAGLIDVDLDCTEAIQLASHFLPETLTFGRVSKPRSHWLYIADDLIPQTARYQTHRMDESERMSETLVELRSTGGQTVFPPSVHPSGESIAFTEKLDVLRIPGGELAEAVKRLAVACLFVRNWPRMPGTRNDCALALAGALVRAGMSEADTSRFIYAVCLCAGDEEAETRARTAGYADVRLTNGGSVWGWPKVAELLGEDTADVARNWLGVRGSDDDRRGAMENARRDPEDSTEPHGALVIRPVNEWQAGAAQNPKPERLFGDCWFKGELCILFAETNVGKSILATQIGHGITEGCEALPGFPVDGTGEKVLLLDFELSARQFLSRYSDEHRTPFTFDPKFLRSEVNIDFDFFDGWEEAMRAAIESAIIETSARIVIVDNITYLKDETEKSRAALPLMRHLNSLKRRYELSILAQAHTPKRDGSQPITRNHLAGSRNLLNLADSCFALGESGRDEGMRYLKQVKVRETEFTLDSENVALLSLGKDGGFLRFVLEGFGSEVEHLRRRDSAETSELESNIIALRESQPQLSNREIAKRLGTNHTKVSRTLKKVEQGGTPGTPVPPVPVRSTGDGTSITAFPSIADDEPRPWADIDPFA